MLVVSDADLIQKVRPFRSTTYAVVWTNAMLREEHLAVIQSELKATMGKTGRQVHELGNKVYEETVTVRGQCFRLRTLEKPN